MRIQKLPSLVANQIAAGEVIERPASVVKELLENCFDAGARQINIEIGFGGLNQIKISDNGAGIMADDLPLAIAPHATSKISQLNDLYSIASMGFRGEALASIASIAKLKISSKPSHQKHAMCLEAQAGTIINIAPAARSQGTTIEVMDIFFNAPVRKKFLKSERYEYQLIEKVVKRFALSAFKIAISLSHNGKMLLNLPAADSEKSRLNRIQKLLGKAFVDEAYYIDVEHQGMHLSGWFSNPNYQLSQNDKQFVYVNSRMVKDKLVNHAIKKAYEATLYPGRHPACLLFFTLPAEEVDVNVHPTKHELRFQEPRFIHDFISSSLQKGMNLNQQLDLKETLQIEKKEHLNSFVLQEPQRDLVFDKPISCYETETKMDWQPINSHFALIFLENMSYLVDVQLLRRAYLEKKLTNLTKPWSSRPLLVPISYSLPIKNEIKLQNQLGILQEVGLQLSFSGEQDLLIRSLPLALPELHLKLFLDAFFAEKNFSQEGLIQLLIHHQSFNLSNLDTNEIKPLIDFAKSFIQIKGNRIIKELSLDVCKDFINA